MHDLCVCVGGGGRAAARGGRADGRQHRHQGPARPRRLSAPPRYWRRRSRAISLRPHHAHSQPGERRHLHGGSGQRGGEGGNKTRPAQPGGEQLPSPPSPPSPPPALLFPSRPLALLRQPPPPPVPPLPLHQLHPGNSEAAAFGKPRQFPPRPSSATLGPPPLPRATPARRLRQTSARSPFPLPLPLRPGSTPPHPSVLSGCRCFFSGSRRPLPFQFKETPAWGPARGWSQGPRGAPGRSRLREEDGGAPEKPSRTK
ncbi:WAS/WASL-interacting protein family member 1-like [Artibeus jamaicensis]|uniref:WAS/WASL-interacting protein family member 1-like n=1 Tax=Artibeus jamaicensis TaxID=9417 RepID=UPI00235B2D79|nr:WAS/WASL-interacting protein family member 1-like [Artibeus jamaicensis]